ncbi:hypothetical protein [Promicromonospora sp. NPDC023987]|uniref:hypothetical protein n=1 Tax=Promicromonospora sp. NPDC023987 TaxID=3155360 RepID=UPI0033CDFD4E
MRATLVATSGDRGSIARLTLLDGRVLLVLHVIADRDGETVIAPGAELRFVRPEDLWAALQAALPAAAALRAPAGAASAAAADSPTPDNLTPDNPTRDDTARPLTTAEKVWPAAVLADEEANLQVVVEAWPTPDRPTTVWARLWSVVDGKLLDVRRRGGETTPVERPAGSVAAELQWALVGAIGVVREVPTDLSSES